MRVVTPAIRPAFTRGSFLKGGVSLIAVAAVIAAVGLVNLLTIGVVLAALAIACALREAILDPQATAALVTPDRQLARRVATELARFSVEANDSGGTPFALTPHGSLLALALPLAAGEADPAALLALLKHPLARFGADRAAHMTAVAHLEMLALRGGSGHCQPDAPEQRRP